MGSESAERMEPGCPLCRLCAWYRRSWVGREVRGVERELLLAARGVIDRCLDHLKESGGRGSDASKPEECDAR